MQTKSDFIMAFTDATANLAQVGGKGASLTRMAIAGLPVPCGFHVTTDAYRYFITANGLQPKILAAIKDVDPSLPTTLETASATIGRFFAESQIPADIAIAITDAYIDLNRQSETLTPGASAGVANREVPEGGKSVAVRSSATAEDLPEASFAGQQETFLNIHCEETLLEAVKKCWASLWTARAIAYRIKNNIDQNCVALAVVVQEMVNAEASGILFTANPINGHRDEIVINAAWGLGEAIVGGLVSPDTITAEKATGKIKKYDVAEKTVITVLAESGTREEMLEGWRRRSKVMKEAQVRELVHIARGIESYYGSPQDIEFCFAKGKFFIVQSRPITALPPEPLEWTIPVKGAVLARGSFAEFVPEPVSPLFATLAVPIAHKSTMELMGGFGVTGENNYVFAVLNDYVYVGFVFSPKMAWQMLKVSFQLLGPIIRTAEQRAREAREKFVGVVQKWQVCDLSALAPSEILIGVREIFTETALYYNMAQSGTIPTSMMTEMFFGSVYKMLIKRKDDLSPEAFMFGTENHAMRADKALWDIAVWVQTQPALLNYLSGASADEINEVLRSDVQPNSEMEEFSKRFNTYLQEYGHAIYDLDFAKPTPVDDPTPLLETLKVHLAGRNNPYERQRAALEVRENAKEKIFKRLDPLRRKWFLNLLKSAQDKAPLREDSIADLGLGHPQIRCMLGELGQRLAAGNAIACAEDIYWLEESEVNALATLLENNEPLPNFDKDIETRKAKWQAMRQIVPPNTLPKVGWLAKFYADNEQTSSIIKGFAASAGKVTARACVMLGPEDFSKMHTGDVIVAGITTPAWTPLFARASAIVTDIGGPLSHSSIVAREYGIPAVLATGVGTRRIQSGQTITVDGSKGEVILETAAERNAPPLKWNLPNPHTVAARMSFVEFVPDAVSPLFATLAVPIASQVTSKMMLEVMGWKEHGYYFDVVNHYVYGCLDTRQILKYFLVGIAASPKILQYGKASREAAPTNSRAITIKWREADLSTLPAMELINGVRELFEAAAYYFTMMQSGPIPTSMMNEALFSRVYNGLIKRRSDPAASAFLIGLEDIPLRAETSLFDMSQWIQGQPALTDYIRQTPSHSIWQTLQTDPVPAPFSGEFATRFTAHLDAFGHAIYDLDFTKSVPADDPTHLLDTLKVYLAGQGHDPNVRIQSQVKQRLQAEQSIVARLDPWRRRWFQKLLKNAQEAAPERENAIADLGLTYPQIKRVLRELGLRLTKGGVIACPEDIYWLEATELDELAASLDKHVPLKDFSARVSTRKADWQRALTVTPPAVLATNKWLSKLFTSKKAKTKNTLKGYGASAGTVTAPARVLRSSEDFSHMHPGEILVAVTTTPAWTPLFAMASAVVTDIGGPLSHSSIVAREYGIPAVLATGDSTRRIHDGELITVDGNAGTVTLHEKNTSNSDGGIDWKAPDPKGIYMRTSVVDLMPDPLSPLYASWAIPVLRAKMKPLGVRLKMGMPVLQEDYYTSINNYAYMNANFPPRAWWWIITGMLPAYPYLLRKMVTIWREELHPEYRAAVLKYQGKIPEKMTTSELWQDAQDILGSAMYYVSGLLFATMGASAGAEGLLTRVYNKVAKQEGDPDATVLLMGWDNIPVRAEKSLYDLAMWCRERVELAQYILATPSGQLTRRLKSTQIPVNVDANEWKILQERFERHLQQFGHIIFQLDFAEPLPLDDPAPMLENIKMYLRGEGTNPHERQKTSAEKRVQTSELMRNRLKGFKRWAFVKALNWAQSMAEVREDALAEIGLGYPMLRAMLHELGCRFAQAGVIAQPEDIFWLQKDEVPNCVLKLEHDQRPDGLFAQVEQRKAFWKKVKQETPPPMIPMKKKFMGINTSVWLAESESNRTGNILKGVATSIGKVTALACILHGPEDFNKMHHGNVLVAGTTTPAWTPIFAMASAIVTDIGGPLSHGSIVAREYGIPAVMGTGVATKRVHDGQTITVDGSVGTVTLG